MIFDSLALVGQSNPSITRASFSLVISESQGLFVLSNPCVTSHSSSFMIFDSLGAVSDVECNYHTGQQFVDDF
jgi:hypothetical protein